MSGRRSSVPGNSLMACTNRAPAAYDPVRKYAFAPSPSTRQSSTPSDSRNCVGLMWSVMKPPPCDRTSRYETTEATPSQHGGLGVRHRADDPAISPFVPSVIPADDDPPLDIPERQGRRLRIDRVACRARETAPGLDRHCPQRTSPCPDDLAVGQDAARPNARRPERAATRGVGDQEFTIASLEKEIRVAARQKPRGSRGAWGGAKNRLVARQDPRVADRRSHRGQRTTERVERRDASPRADPRPLTECFGRGRTEDVQISTRELEACVAGVDLRSRDGPDGWLSRTVPPNQDRAGRCGVPEAIGVVFAEGPARLAERHPRAAEEAAHASGEVLRDAQRAAFVRQPPEREDREVPCRHDVRVVTRPPDLDERRVFPGRGLGPLNTRMDREERSARHAVLQARPRRTPKRAPSPWESRIKRADPAPECEDLCPGEAERRPCHVRPPHSWYLGRR